MNIKDILKRLLLQRGVEIAEVARTAGISRQSLTNIISGKTARPQNKTVQRLAKYFEVPPEYLLYGDDDEQEPDIAELRHEVAELEKRLNGPSFQKVVVDDYQRERLIGKYFKGGVSGVLLVELAGMPDKMLEEFIRVLYVYDEIKRRADANAGNNRKGNGDS